MYRSNKGLDRRLTSKKILNKDKKIRKKKIRKIDNLRLNLVKKFTKISILIVIILALILKTYFFFINAPFFTVCDPIILGNKVILTKEIYKKVKNYYKEFLQDKDPNIFKIDLKDLSSYLQAQFIEIKKVIVERKLPNKIVIRIIEKEPLALVNTDYGIVNVDKDGYVFIISQRGEDSYPIITGVDSSKVRLRREIKDPKVKKVLGLINNIKSINSNLLDEFSEFNINRSSQIKAYTTQGGARVFFGRDLSLNIVKKLLAIISYAEQKKENIEYIDLRFKNIVVSLKIP
ncbi:MAG: cell division protein FtsQ/DivIB [bacterium]|nr:cell division protein FtsQ/DivIB [bacterium]